MEILLVAWSATCTNDSSMDIRSYPKVLYIYMYIYTADSVSPLHPTVYDMTSKAGRSFTNMFRAATLIKTFVYILCWAYDNGQTGISKSHRNRKRTLSNESLR